MNGKRSLFAESQEVKVEKLKKIVGQKRKHNDVLDNVLTEFSIFDSPQQLFDSSKEKLSRYTHTHTIINKTFENHVQHQRNS